MNRFKISDTPLDGLKLLERLVLRDPRGSLERMFCANDLGAILGVRSVVQINRTVTARRGVVRGMHFQRAPHAECKIVSCLRGEVFDVAVDLRAGSPTFLRWHAQMLSAGNAATFFIPEGFAHGLQTLSDDCEMLYLHTAAYAPEFEGGVSPRDPRLAIDWPLPISFLSERDAAHPPLDSGFRGLDS